MLQQIPEFTWPGLSPQEIESNDFFTKTETQELVDAAGAEAKEYADDLAASTLLSSQTYTDEAISHIGISGYVTDEELEAAKAELDGKIALKADEADLQVVSGAVDTNSENIQTLSGDVDALELVVSNKAEKSVVDTISGDLDTHEADNTIHVTAADKTAWNAKAEVSDIPTDNAQLTNGAGYQTAQDVQNAISGKAETSYVDTELAKKQDIIDESNPISGNAVLVTYDPWTGDPEFTAEAAINMTHAEALQAQVDATQANADIQIVSGALDGKLDNPSGGTAGQVLTKTETGSEWADAQGGGESIEAPVNYFKIWYGLRGGSYSGNLTFSFVKSNSNAPDLDLSFSTDKGNTWTKMEWNGGLSGTFMTPYSQGEIWAIYIKGNNDAFASSDGVNYRWYYTLKSNVNNTLWAHVGGNIMTLLDETGRSRYVPDCGLPFLFLNFSMLINASNLKLPATSLGYEAYGYMFDSCSNLQYAPYELPALELGRGAYYSMFSGCSSMEKAPKIKAIFWNSLATNSNFYKAFGYMFNDCTSLSSVNVDFDDWRYTPGFSSYSNFTNWLNNVAASGQFICPYELDTSTRDASYVPAGWELVYKEVPESVLSGATAATEALTMING